MPEPATGVPFTFSVPLAMVIVPVPKTMLPLVTVQRPVLLPDCERKFVNVALLIVAFDSVKFDSVNPLPFAEPVSDPVNERMPAIPVDPVTRRFVVVVLSKVGDDACNGIAINTLNAARMFRKFFIG